MIFNGSGPTNIFNPHCDLLAQFCKPHVKTLGMILDGTPKSDRQVSSAAKATKTYFQSKPFLSFHDLEKVILAFISSRLDYCNMLLTGISKSSLNHLQVVQDAATRLLTNTLKCDHIIPLLAALHWLPVHFRIDFELLLFVSKALVGLVPAYLSELLHPYQLGRSLRSSNQFLLEVLHSRSKLRGDRAFSVAGPKLWNSLPPHIRSALNLKHLHYF